MKNAVLRFTLVIAILLSLTSCSKDEPTPDYEKLLSAHTWVKGNIRSESNDEIALEMAQVYLMIQDNYEITFNANGAYTTHFKSGTWEVSGNKILFDQDSPYSKSFWPIHELKSNSLKVSWTAIFMDINQQKHEATIYLDLIPKR